MALGPDEKAVIKGAAQGLAAGALAPIHELIRELAGPAASEIGEALGLRLKVWRLGRAARLANRVREILRPLGIDRRPVALKILLPAIEHASLEDDDDLQDRWAALLANAAVGNTIHPSYVEILHQMSSLDAKILSMITGGTAGRRIGPDEVASALYGDTRNMIEMFEKHVDEHDLGEREAQVAHSLDNLTRLGLAKMVRQGVRKDDQEHWTMTLLGHEFVLACSEPYRSGRRASPRPMRREQPFDGGGCN